MFFKKILVIFYQIRKTAVLSLTPRASNISRTVRRRSPLNCNNYCWAVISPLVGLPILYTQYLEEIVFVPAMAAPPLVEVLFCLISNWEHTFGSSCIPIISCCLAQKPCQKHHYMYCTPLSDGSLIFKKQSLYRMDKRHKVF